MDCVRAPKGLEKKLATLGQGDFRVGMGNPLGSPTKERDLRRKSIRDTVSEPSRSPKASHKSLWGDEDDEWGGVDVASAAAAGKWM